MVKKTATLFGLAGYLLTMLYYFGPSDIAMNETLFHFVPFWMCILTGHGMPILPVVFLIAPINAGICGAVGATAGAIAILVKAWSERKGEMGLRCEGKLVAGSGGG